MLAPSAFLASAAGAENIISSMLPQRLQNVTDPAVEDALAVWKSKIGQSSLPPDSSCSRFQKAWDQPCCQWLAADLLSKAQSQADKARLLACSEGASGAWLKAVPLATIGLKLDDH